MIKHLAFDQLQPINLTNHTCWNDQGLPRWPCEEPENRLTSRSPLDGCGLRSADRRRAPYAGRHAAQLPECWIEDAKRYDLAEVPLSACRLRPKSQLALEMVQAAR